MRYGLSPRHTTRGKEEEGKKRVPGGGSEEAAAIGVVGGDLEVATLDARAVHCREKGRVGEVELEQFCPHNTRARVSLT
jgi:ABC-type phosphate/phosphonate transport system substrate-binding protein